MPGQAKKIFKYAASMGFGLLLLGAMGLYLAVFTLLSEETGLEALSRGPLFRILGGLILLNMSACLLRQLGGLCRYWRTLRLKPRLRRLLLLLLHGGVVLMTGGLLLSGFAGDFEKFAMFEGDCVDISAVSGGVLPGFFQLDDFTVPLGEAGEALQYSASFTLFEGQSGPRAHTVSVNKPVKFSGCKLYLSEYLHGIGVRILDGGEERSEVLGEGDGLEFASTEKTIAIVRYVPDYDPETWQSSSSLLENNPVIVFSEILAEGEDGRLLQAGIGEWVRLGEDCYLCFEWVRPYVVFALRRDPGSPLAAAGALLFLLSAWGLLFLRKEKA